MAVTTHGGELLATEVSILPGKGKLVLTGSLGDVMQESAHAAMSYVRSRVESFGLDVDFYQRVDVHVHFPEGAIPKDGPSAGITMATALMSLALDRKVKRKLSMTGELTLTGRVLPVGGIKEKVIAAKRAGVEEIIMPALCERDFAELPKHLKEGITFHLLSTIDEVLETALEG